MIIFCRNSKIGPENRQNLMKYLVCKLRSVFVRLASRFKTEQPSNNFFTFLYHFLFLISLSPHKLKGLQASRCPQPVNSRIYSTVCAKSFHRARSPAKTTNKSVLHNFNLKSLWFTLHDNVHIAHSFDGRSVSGFPR